MISRRRHLMQKKFTSHIEKLEQINASEEKAVIDEVTKIKRSHIKKFGYPKTMTGMSLKGIAPDTDK